MAAFVVGQDVNHRVGDLQCRACAAEYPEGCPCGGLVHATAGDDEDADGNPVLTTRCDQCGRSSEDLAEAV